jgi:hypothetical protein
MLAEAQRLCGVWALRGHARGVFVAHCQQEALKTSMAWIFQDSLCACASKCSVMTALAGFQGGTTSHGNGRCATGIYKAAKLIPAQRQSAVSVSAGSWRALPCSRDGLLLDVAWVSHELKPQGSAPSLLAKRAPGGHELIHLCRVSSSPLLVSLNPCRGRARCVQNARCKLLLPSR